MPATTAHPLDEVIAVIRERQGDLADVLERFARFYLHGLAPEDLARFEIGDLYGAIVSHWRLAHEHRAGSPAKVRVYNPRLEDDAWQSLHSIVEIVADDAPFLVDSARMAINRCGHGVHLVIHPGLFGDEPEVFIHFEIDRHTERQALDRVRGEIERALADVATAVADFEAMRARVGFVLQGLASAPPPIDPDELAEGEAFLRWLRDGNFIFLAYREHDLVHEDGDDWLRIVPGSALGLLRERQETDHPDGPAPRPSADARASMSFSSLPPRIRTLARDPELLVITRSSSPSTVHRPGFLDYVGVKRIDGQGRVTGEHRFLGLYTASAYNAQASGIPLLRRRIAWVLSHSGYHERSHSTRALLNILENLPRDELFQSGNQQLLDTALGVLQLQERQRTRLLVRADPFGRFLSCLVFLPRDHMNTRVRIEIGALLQDAFAGEVTSFSVQMDESVLARIHYVVRIASDATRDYDFAAIEKRIETASRPWQDQFAHSLVQETGEEEGARLYRRYGEALRNDYREYYPARIAVHDARQMESLTRAGDVALSLYRPIEAPANTLRFKLFHLGATVPLSDTLPMLENMGLRVIDDHSATIRRAPGDTIHLHDLGMEHAERDLDLDEVRQVFEDAFVRIFRAEAANDSLNRLALRAGIDWRRVMVLRAYARYLRQVRATFSQRYMEDALVNNAHIASMLVESFELRLDPDREEEREARSRALDERILAALEEVANLDEDRILRAFARTIGATLRTNFWQRDARGEPKDYLSFKVDPSRVPDMPEPRPMFEIFVYSPRVEGVHLRGGRVARGGLRWSDRPEDFRTEVLGLVKAQMVKNAVIVPVGSKGGFVPKRMPSHADRDAQRDEAIQCYRTFISGMLDLTDNLVAGEVRHPPRTVRHDPDDPYLVVAADKGTATFSDIANEVSRTYGYWLGDAFASGGSAGYDHKAMAITARGAWESVKRHFRELGTDIQREPFTVVGIGDMSGDVFGNGMLLSRRIRLLGAFDHRHVFLDPDPDCERSFAERERLFAKPGSSWNDYDRAAISEGGGVWPRTTKSIPLSDAVRLRLKIDAANLTPNELIRAMLKAPVDLLWNGGIGTWIKASDEPHAEVGDRGNDALRVDAAELRCRVIGEGGNLGVTQRGRIEFALRNGRIYTDAIDNSAGVDCSDHEVNIKILLNAVVDAGDMTMKQRNALLAQMTDEVAALVLRNNYLQTQALSLARLQSNEMLAVHARMLRDMETNRGLDRALEFLPDDKTIGLRGQAGAGLTAPELAVMLAYLKIGLFDRLLASDLPDDEYLERTLAAYFPAALSRHHPAAMRSHRLRREIIATEVANGVVNRAGLSFVHRMHEETGASDADIVRAYVVVRDVYGLRALWDAIEALDNQVPAELQSRMLLESRRLLERAARWLLRQRPRPIDIAAEVDRHRLPVTELLEELPDLIGETERASVNAATAQLAVAGVPEALAERIGLIAPQSLAFSLVDLALATDRPAQQVARMHFQVGEALELPWLRDRIAELPRATQWQTLARAAQRNDLLDLHRQITASVLRTDGDRDPAAALQAWRESNAEALARVAAMMAAFRGSPSVDFPMLSVALSEMRSLLQTAGGPR